jgi:hypothetical protein
MPVEEMVAAFTAQPEPKEAGLVSAGISPAHSGFVCPRVTPDRNKPATLHLTLPPPDLVITLQRFLI